MNLVIAPHNDDETLFTAYTLIHEKPLVAIVTDSFIQPNRGDIGCSSEERWQESVSACKILGCPVIRLGIRDDSLTREVLESEFKKFVGFEKVYVPAIQGGNWQHDLISKVATEVFGSACVYYTTYTKTELWTKGKTEIAPVAEESALKIAALKCYQSQINLPSTRPHFEAVLDKSEWLL